MGNWVEVVSRTALVGVGATVVLDAWLLVMEALGVPKMNFALLGRWVGHACRGRWLHPAIAQAKPVRGELAIGWAAHYGIGMGFAGLLVATLGVDWLRNPAVVPAVLMGIVTVMAPLFILQPAMGSGIASSRTAAPLRNCIKSVVNHAVFGVGLYVSAAVLQWT